MVTIRQSVAVVVETVADLRGSNEDGGVDQSLGYRRAGTAAWAPQSDIIEDPLSWRKSASVLAHPSCATHVVTSRA